MAPPEPVLWLPLKVKFSTSSVLSKEKIAPPASAPLRAVPPSETPHVTILLTNVLLRTTTVPLWFEYGTTQRPRCHRRSHRRRGRRKKGRFGVH
jgi:hypothetical protein